MRLRDVRMGGAGGISARSCMNAAMLSEEGAPSVVGGAVLVELLLLEAEVEAALVGGSDWAFAEEVAEAGGGSADWAGVK